MPRTKPAVALAPRFTTFSSPDKLVPDDGPTSDRIIDAARRCYGRVGWAKTSIEEVLRLANVSRATVYKYFPSSEQLRKSVIALGLSAIRADLADATRLGSDLSESLGNSAVALAIWWSHVHAEDAPDTLYFRIHSETLMQIVQILEDVLRPRLLLAQQTGEIHEDRDIERTAQWVARCIGGIVFFSIGDDERDGLDPTKVRDLVSEFAVPAL